VVGILIFVVSTVVEMNM
jgi:hypothetical protein